MIKAVGYDWKNDIMDTSFLWRILGSAQQQREDLGHLKGAQSKASTPPHWKEPQELVQPVLHLAVLTPVQCLLGMCWYITVYAKDIKLAHIITYLK